MEERKSRGQTLRHAPQQGPAGTEAGKRPRGPAPDTPAEQGPHLPAREQDRAAGGEGAVLGRESARAAGDSKARVPHAPETRRGEQDAPAPNGPGATAGTEERRCRAAGATTCCATFGTAGAAAAG